MRFGQRAAAVRSLGFMGLFGLVGGVLSAADSPELTAIFVGLVVAALIVSSRTAIFWFVVIGALVVTGVAQLYLPGSRYVRYVVPLASLALAAALGRSTTSYDAARFRRAAAGARDLGFRLRIDRHRLDR